jgi:hypothetical protein
MIEFKINNWLDREKVLIGLANSGYKVKVVEKVSPSPKYYGAKDFYVQVEIEEEIK